MKEECIDLKYGKLHLIKTDKFRTIEVKVLFKDIIKKEEITKRNFLTDYLILTTKKYNTRKKLAIKIGELYSLFLSSYNTRIGNYYITRFNMSLLDPKYTEDLMLEESFDLLHEVIFEPNFTNKKANRDYFNIVKNNLESSITTITENPRAYANLRMLENMNINKPYAYNTLGYLEDLEKISESNLVEYYEEFINKSLIDIYVIGDIDFKKVKEIVLEKLNFKTIKKERSSIYITHDKITSRVRKVIEERNYNQSKLSIGCKINSLTEFERKYVINLYNMILGGGFNSKFMKILREKKSLAYYINSNVNKADNLLIIQSGISYENFDKVIRGIKKIMKSISEGHVSDIELEEAKIEYLSILEETYDNIDNIVENYIASNLLDLDNYETKKEMIKKVSREDIININKKIYPSVIYLLKGDIYEKD